MLQDRPALTATFPALALPPPGLGPPGPLRRDDEGGAAAGAPPPGPRREGAAPAAGHGQGSPAIGQTAGVVGGGSTTTTPQAFPYGPGHGGVLHQLWAAHLRRPLLPCVAAPPPVCSTHVQGDFRGLAIFASGMRAFFQMVLFLKKNWGRGGMVSLVISCV